MNKIHFVGIGGSGLSGIAMLAKAQGYKITGCDLNTSSYYIEELKKDNVKILEGQDESHLNQADLVVATPAVFFQIKSNPEIVKAKKEKKLLTGPEFLGKYLQKDKKVICIAGTHGKSTTTAMISLLFEKAKQDPSVMIGANVKEWGKNYRAGNGIFFVTESDEFFESFLNYNPDIIVLNNIEFDHPDYFKNEEIMFDSFKKFILKLKGMKILIYNQDDKGIKRLFKLIGKKELATFNIYGYSTKGIKIEFGKNETKFEFEKEIFKIEIPGEYNVRNALGVIILGKLFKIPTEIIKKSLIDFHGLGRRLDLIGDRNGIKVYDDYAHHPTAIKATLEALRQKYPKEKILAIIEPHTFSRTKALLPLYQGAFDDADEVIIAPIFKSRDTENFGISGQLIVESSNHKNAKYLDSFKKIISYVNKNSKNYDIIIVMGAGESYKLAYEITGKNKIS